MKKSIVRVGCFLVILLLILCYCNSVFKLKQIHGIYNLTKYYEQDTNSVDVLILGSSHAYQNINTGTLWDEQGMSTYILAGAVQPMWNTYFYLKEALKTQKPKLIILEGFSTMLTQDFMEDKYIVFNNFGLRWSRDKIESIKVSAPSERWVEFFLEYIQYHTRYAELTKEDFLRNQGDPLFNDWKGFYCNMLTTPFSPEDMSDITERCNLTEKTEKYYRAILCLAKESGIPILVVISPYPGLRSEFQKCFNRAGDIAEEEGVPFLNCNLILQEIGIDFSVDAADNDHLNYKGSRKYSSYLGKFISERYDLPDHRGEQEYASWERNAKYIRQLITNQELVESCEGSFLCEQAMNSSYWAIVSIDGICHPSGSLGGEYLQKLGISEQKSAGMWLINGKKTIWSTEMGDACYYTRTRAHDFFLATEQNEDGFFTNSVIVDNVRYGKVANGINIVIYDTLTEKIVDSFGFDADNAYNLVR